MSQETDLLISIASDSTIDSEDLDQLTRQLLEEIVVLDLISAEIPYDDQLPDYAKGTALGVGIILVKIAEYGGLVGLLRILGSWLSRDERRKVVLQLGKSRLEVQGISKTQQTELIQWFQTQIGNQLTSWSEHGETASATGG